MTPPAVLICGFLLMGLLYTHKCKSHQGTFANVFLGYQVHLCSALERVLLLPLSTVRDLSGSASPVPLAAATLVVPPPPPQLPGGALSK